MSTRHRRDSGSEPSYRSGAAARLTRIPVETLRVWERRYGVVGPQQSPTGRRLYSAADIERLTLIKRLVDLGNPIGSIASLGREELAGMLALADAASRPAAQAGAVSTGTCRIAVAGESLVRAILAEADRLPGIAVTSTAADLAEAGRRFGAAQADAVVVEVPVLLPETLDEVDRLRDATRSSRFIIVYGYGPGALVRRLRAAGCLLAHAPVEPEVLLALCTGAASLAMPALPGEAPDSAPPPRRFDERALAEFAASVTSIYCECPRHLAQLLASLNGFEAYSAQCETRDARDAQLHAYLRRVAGTARALIEEALARVAAAEGLAVTAPSA